jgi:hypothetical protein
MTRILATLGFVLAASTASFAMSGALDVIDTPAPAATGMAAGVDWIATSSIGNTFEMRDRLGDGSPSYANSAGAGALLATGASSDGDWRAKLGDGSPMVY